jgi:hypothetical protein
MYVASFHDLCSDIYLTYILPQSVPEVIKNNHIRGAVSRSPDTERLLMPLPLNFKRAASPDAARRADLLKLFSGVAFFMIF